MQAGMIIFIIIVLIFIGGIVYMYYKYEKPMHEEVLQYVDLSVFAKEQGTEIFNETGYKIYANDIFLSEGATAKYGGVLERIPMNRTITISNYNIGTQDYYLNNQSFNTNENRTYRIVLELVKPGNLSFEQKGIFSNNEFLFLNITAIGDNRELYYCITWSRHIIFVDSKLDNRTSKNESLGKCYNFGSLKNKEKKQITIEYKKFGIIDKDDFIWINFYDFTDKLRISHNLNNCDEFCYIN